MYVIVFPVVTQASRTELMEALRALAAVEVRGVWRVLQPSYMRTVVDLLMGVTMEHDWSASAVPVEPAVAALVRVRASGLENPRRSNVTAARTTPPASKAGVMMLCWPHASRQLV